MENNDQNLNNQVNTNNSNVNQPTQNNANKIVFTLMALIIVGLAGYIVYTKFIQKDDKPEPKPNNTQEQGNNNSDDNGKNNNQQSSNNTVLDLSQISTKSFKVRDFQPEKLETIQGEKKFDLVGENNATLTINFDGTKATLKYKSNKKNITKEISNVSKVSYSDYGICSPHTLVYVISSNKIFLVNIDNYSDSYEEELTESNFVKEISNSNSYADIYMDYLHPATCDFIPLWLGRTADGKYYDLSTSTEYSGNTYFYYNDGNNYVKSDKSYKLGNNSGKVSVVFIDEVDEDLEAYIDANDYLYEFDYSEESWGRYKLVLKEKVVKVQKQEEKFIFEFANGEKKELEFGYSPEVYK